MAEQNAGAGQEGLTPQEAAFFESGGTQTEGLAGSTPAPQGDAPVGHQAQQPAQQQQDPAQQQQEPRTVPLAALQEERAERKRLRDELQQVRTQQEVLVQRILANQQPQQAQQPAPQIPDFQQDPVGHLRAQNDLLTRQMQALVGHLSGQEQQQQYWSQQQAAQQQLANYVATEEHAFRAQAPDYDAAAAYVRQAREAEYRALGMTNPMEIQQAMQGEIAQMANIARNTGTSIAEAVYNLAKSRGYKAGAPSARAGQGAGSQQDAAARLATIAQGQQQAASLGNAGGAAPPGMSIERLLAMDDAEFSKATGGMNWQKLNAELSR